MTIPASLLGNAKVSFGNANGFGKASGGEIVRMPKTIERFGGILAHKIVRRMAIVAGCHLMMAAFDPAVVLLLHDMAVFAGLRIVA